MTAKRPKMTDGPSTEGGSAMSLNLDTAEFAEVLHSPAFVDKSLLIQAILEDEKQTVILTAPRKFGKTTNATMVRHFVEVETDSEGKPLTATEWPREAVRDTPNYQLFAEHKLKICEEGEVMDAHFGKYPLIRTDLVCTEDVTTVKEAVDFYKEHICQCFKDHSYLARSEKLSEEDRVAFEQYHDFDRCTQLEEVQVLEGLRLLAKLLHQHFNRKCFVLVDSYDSLVSRIMFTMKNKTVLKKIIDLNSTLLSHLFKYDECIFRTLITGTSSIAGVDLDTATSNVHLCRFLKRHPYVHFYGLTREEVDTLFQKFAVGDELRQEAHRHYDGYTSLSEHRVYSPSSIFHFLNRGTVQNYWTEDLVVVGLECALQLSTFKFYVEALVQDRTVSVVRKIRRISMEDLVTLKMFLTDPQKYQDMNPELYLLLLLERGYLSLKVGPANRTIFRLPNLELREVFLEKLRQCYVNLCKFDKGLLYNCVQAFNNLTRSDITVEDKMLRLCSKLQQLCSGFSDNYQGLPLSNINFHHLLFFVACQTRFVCRTKTDVVKNRLDLVLVKDGFGVIMQPDFGGNPRAALQVIIEKILYTGIESEIGSLMLIGVNLSTYRRVSMSVLVDSKDINKDVRDFRVWD